MHPIVVGDRVAIDVARALSRGELEPLDGLACNSSALQELLVRSGNVGLCGEMSSHCNNKNENG
jgi:hypothetical protein